MSSLHYEHYKFVADKGQKPLRVDKFLLNFIEFATRNKIQNAIKLGHVKINNIVEGNPMPASIYIIEFVLPLDVVSNFC